MLSLEHFLLRCCSAPAHEAWARKAAAAAPGSVLPAATDWRAALGVRRWDIRRVRQPSGSHALVLSKRSADPVSGPLATQGVPTFSTTVHPPYR